MRRSLLLVWGLALGGCAWEPGQGFAVVEPSVRVAYEPLASRAASDGYQRLSSDYQVRLDSASMRLSGIELLASASGSGSGTTFDPARPPPGYSLCHGGHCHRDDGALIPYEQVAAEMGGGGGSSAVVTLATEAPLDLLAPETRAMACAPECALPQTQVSQGRWSVASLRLVGTVRDSRVPARFQGERSFELELPTGTTTDAPVAILTGAVDLPSDRTTPPEAKLRLDLVLTAALFDPVDWGKLVQGDNPVLFNEDARKALVERLSQLKPQAEVSRGE
ncbi:putative lipoprotein [Cystobacter fuscus DSM 2262]|uniref:Lipoprotein n=1 Tax=Cystobacter fuscus (strain ATCC 25194 / DSM 2262 / NBRC 100088 / M29) TaxID=1242864 RepID=S9Q273_CYSF2|nr:hypothetical protein [Cystobacter fuscus]EPX55399.1 putative lipoprotein [Cystobacter fuscus DSM 2262]